MLSRTAENLFWIARYVERAETMARLLEVGYRMAMMPSSAQGYRSEWASILAAAGSASGFAGKYGPTPRQGDVEAWLFFDRDNPASVVNCIDHARRNGRAVRTALTSEVWDALNGGWLDLAPMSTQPRSSARLPELCDWTKRLGAQVRGAIEGTLQRREGYDFINLGCFVERSDNTARLIDVKYFVLLPTTDMVGGSVDSYQWTTLLRAVSAYRAFHWAYGGEVTAGKVADFLILNGESPRSLLTSLYEAVWHLDGLVRRYGAEVPASASGRAHETLEQLMARDIEAIFDEGLHEFLSWFINELASISNAVHDDYLSGRM